MADSPDESNAETVINGGFPKTKKPVKVNQQLKNRYSSMTNPQLNAHLTVDQLFTALDRYFAENAPQHDGASSTPAAPTAPTVTSAPSLLFSARIKLNCKENGHTYDCGHEVMRIGSSWNYVDLCANIKNKFTNLQSADATKRSNIGPCSYWSNIHKIVEIKTSCASNAVNSWVPLDDEQGQTVITQENCADVLDMIKNVVVPSLSVVIAPPPSKD
jgi:hypothetical protein